MAFCIIIMDNYNPKRREQQVVCCRSGALVLAHPARLLRGFEGSSGGDASIFTFSMFLPASTLCLLAAAWEVAVCRQCTDVASHLAGVRFLVYSFLDISVGRRSAYTGKCLYHAKAAAALSRDYCRSSASSINRCSVVCYF